MSTLANFEVSGEYSIDFIDKSTGGVTYGPRFKNLITDVGISSGTISVVQCRLGTGGAAKTFGDTSLESPVGPYVIAQADPVTGHIANNVVEYLDSETKYVARNVYTFNFDWEEDYAGTTIREVGAFTSGGSPSMFSTALILNNVGVPEGFVIPEGSTTQVTYTVSIFVNSDVVGWFYVGGTPVSLYTLRPNRFAPNRAWSYLNFNMNNMGWLAYLSSNTQVDPLSDTSIGGFSDNTGVTLVQTFSGGVLTTKISLILSKSFYNFAGGIGGIGIGYDSYNYHITFNPKLTKNSSTGWNFQDFLTFTWGRA